MRGRGMQGRLGASFCLAMVVAGVGAVMAQAQGTAPSAVAPDASLARFVPREGVVAFFEFDGLEAHGGAWRNSAAYRVLNQTSTGAMLEELVIQLAGKAAANDPAVSMTGEDVVAVMKHVALNGMVASLSGKQSAGDQSTQPHGVLVLRNAARKDFRPLFAKIISTMMGPGAKPAVSVKATRQVVEVPGQGGQANWAWWTERDDLVVVRPASDADAVIATIDGKSPSAVEHPTRVELSQVEGNFEPVMRAFLDPKNMPDLSVTDGVGLSKTGFEGVERLDYRVGFDGPATMAIGRVKAPAPRSGMLAVVDQPGFSVTSLPPLPANVESFTVFSLDALKTYDQVVAYLKQNDPPTAQKVAEVEQTVQQRIRRRFREDLLGLVGPSWALFQLQKPLVGGGLSRRVGDALAGGLQVPKGALVLEVKDANEFGRTLDELILQANKLIEQQMSTMMPPPPEPPPGQAGSRDRGKPKPPQYPKFERRSVTSRFFTLSLPPQFAAMTNLQLTVALGEKHVVISSAADTAQAVLNLEGDTKGRWTPPPMLADTMTRLPAGLKMLQMNDPGFTLPETLAGLPGTVSEIVAQLEKGPAAAGALAMGGGGPGGTSGSRVFDPRSKFQSVGGSTSGDPGGSQPGPMDSENVTSGSGSSNTSGSGSSSGGYQSNSSGGAATKAASGPRDPKAPISLDPKLAPRPEEVRAFLFPAIGALTVDEREIRLVNRMSFPSAAVSPATVGIGAALLLPAVQAAREAARGAQSSNNLKQVALAMHNFASANGGRFPGAAILSSDGRPHLSWRVAILPHLGQEALYREFKLDEPWDSPHNKALLSRMPEVYKPTVNPTTDPTSTRLQVFVGGGAPFSVGSPGPALQDFRDGTSNTILAVEGQQEVPWTQPADLTFDPAVPTPALNKNSRGQFQAVLADGAVKEIGIAVEDGVIRSMITSSGGERIPLLP